jgi:putative transposase
VYHVLNRANGRAALFRKEADYAAFERVLFEAYERLPLRILAYCLMPNHWHLVVWPKRGAGDDVSEFFRWLTVTHTQRHHAHYHTSGTGHLYQGRFKSFPVEADEHLYAVLRYVERNPVRAGLVESADEWLWSSAWRYYHAGRSAKPLLAEWPIDRPHDWLRRVNRAETPAELDALRRSTRRSRPYGGAAWQERIVERLGLEWTVRARGRPRKKP